VELNRNHFFALGTVVLFLGIQFRHVESFVLNEKSSRFIAKRIDRKGSALRPFPTLLSVMSPLSVKSPPVCRTVIPPRWMAWSLLSVGAVFMLHSLAMRRPD
jgi:hypothetical protein